MKLLLTILLSAMLSSSFTQTISEKIDSLLFDYGAPNPGAAVLILKDDEAIYKKGMGLATLKENIPVTNETNFRLASITKQFTAAAILLLIEDDAVSLNDKMKNIFPEWPAYANEITVKHILTHTSGLWDYEELIHDSAKIQVKDKDVLDLLLNQDSLYFAPEDSFRYSNSGYAVLKLLVEKVSGKTFSSFLEEKVFKPLGMNNTLAYESGISKVENRAYGHNRTDSGWVEKDQSITSAVLGDGGIYSSIEDLNKWLTAYFNGDVISKKIMEEATSRKKLNNGAVIDYGYGWRFKTFNDKNVIYHPGSTMGGRNIIYLIPEEKIKIIFLSNRNEGDTIAIAEAAAKLLTAR